MDSPSYQGTGTQPKQNNLDNKLLAEPVEKSQTDSPPHRGTQTQPEQNSLNNKLSASVLRACGQHGISVTGPNGEAQQHIVPGASLSSESDVEMPWHDLDTLETQPSAVPAGSSLPPEETRSTCNQATGPITERQVTKGRAEVEKQVPRTKDLWDAEVWATIR